MPQGQYRLGKAGYLRTVRARHRAAGRCVDCGQPASQGTSRCLRHRVYQASWRAKRRAA